MVKEVKEKMDDFGEEQPEIIKSDIQNQRRVKIIIEEQEGDEHSPFVFVSVNGYAYSIRRGFPVEVPESVVHVLNNAIQTKMYQNVETGEITYKDVPRFNFHVTNE